jgi:hypothetical protein
MLHATSVEAVFELSNTGKLPTGIIDLPDRTGHDYTNGRIFFLPGDKGKDILKWETEFYAQKNAQRAYLANALGCNTPEMYQALLEMSLGCLDVKDLQHVLKSQRKEFDLGLLRMHSKKARKRRGVILEANDSILDVPHIKVDGDYAFDCPEGLDRRHISGVELLGKDERRVMDSFLDGKYEYRGFNNR